MTTIVAMISGRQQEMQRQMQKNLAIAGGQKVIVRAATNQIIDYDDTHVG